MDLTVRHFSLTIEHGIKYLPKSVEISSNKTIKREGIRVPGFGILTDDTMETV